MLPGSSLKVGEDVSLNANKIAVYLNSYFYLDGKTSIEGSGLGASKYPAMTDAHFEVNGILKTNGVGGLCDKFICFDNFPESSSIFGIDWHS